MVLNVGYITPIFLEHLMKYDVIDIAEPNIDSFDEGGIPGYVFHSNCRKSFYSRKSDGLGVFITDTISKYVIEVTEESEYILWTGLCKPFFCSNNDVHLGIFYLPSDNSKYFNESGLSDLHDKIASICSNHPMF